MASVNRITAMKFEENSNNILLGTYYGSCFIINEKGVPHEIYAGDKAIFDIQEKDGIIFLITEKFIDILENKLFKERHRVPNKSRNNKTYISNHKGLINMYEFLELFDFEGNQIARIYCGDL